MRLAQGEGDLPLMSIRKPEPRLAGSVDDPGRLDVFEQCFAQYWPAIYGLLRRMLDDPAEAEDLALETFFRLHQRHGQTGADFNIGGWLYRVATNLGLHSIRSLKRRRHYELSAGRREIVSAESEQPAEIAAAHEERRLARRTLAGMSPRHSELLVMRYSGMAYKDIAAALSLSPASIGPLLVRAEAEFERRYRALAQEDT
jgi:RNA polymerase sigma-70 factor (ECF subfamily)